jgi:hypothetical protein
MPPGDCHLRRKRPHFPTFFPSGYQSKRGIVPHTHDDLGRNRNVFRPPVWRQRNPAIAEATLIVRKSPRAFYEHRFFRFHASAVARAVLCQPPRLLLRCLGSPALGESRHESSTVFLAPCLFGCSAVQPARARFEFCEDAPPVFRIPFFPINPPVLKSKILASHTS